MQEFEIRRLSEGTLDIDFYRNRGHELRRRAMRDAGWVPGTRLAVIAGAALGLLALFVAVSAPPADRNPAVASLQAR